MIITAAVREVLDTGQRMGVELDRSAIEDKIDAVLRDGGEFRPSMLQDVDAGRHTEVDTINGAVVRAGEAVGLDVPVSRSLYRLVDARDSTLAR